LIFTVIRHIESKLR